jgi:hypothetical protein
MHKFIKTTLIILAITFCYQKCEASPFIYVPSSMQQAVSALERFPETKIVLDSFKNERGISLNWSPYGQDASNAFWFGTKRAIVLNSSKEWDEGKKISSILLEMHNAKTNLQMYQLDQLVRKKKITRNDYVRSIEKIEHDNAVKTRTLLERGIQQGYFPSTATYPVYLNFEDHFRLQIDVGHSDFIAKHYDAMFGSLA